MNETKELQEVVQQIIKYKDLTGLSLLKKFNQEYLISVLDRQKIQSIDRIYPTKEDGFNLLEFVRFFLNVVDHTEIETLYLTIAIIDFFKEISQANNFCQKIKFNHLTNFICRKILEKRTKQSDIETKHIPNLRKIQPEYDLKQYLLQPPIVYGTAQDNAFKLSLATIQIDKTKHESVVTNCYFSPTCEMIFSLDALSDAISIYNTSCDFVKKIRPSSSRLKKNTVILSFAFSQNEGRVGAVLKDFSLIFWDVHDNFQFQKSISTASHCQQYQSSIYYLNHFKRWVTTDKNGHIYIWNIQIQKPERVIICKNRSKINDLCEVSHLNLVAVVQQNRNDILEVPVKKTTAQANLETMYEKIVLYNFLKGQPAAVIQSLQDKRIPHTLQYSEAFQVILSAGYQKKINVYEIHPKYFDTSLKGQLLGHQSIIACFTVIGKTPMVASADDRGKVKIWDIRNFKCLQTLDFRDKTIITKVLSLIEVGKIGVLGSRINLIEFDEKIQLQRRNNKNQQLQPLYLNCKYDTNSLFVLTKKDFRAIDMKKGTFKHVFCQFCSLDQQITCFKYFEVLNKFIVGNQKGQIKIYCSETGKLQSTCHPHTASVIFIEYDQMSKLFISASSDSNVFIHKTLTKQVRSFKRMVKKDITDKQIKQKLAQKTNEIQLLQDSGVIRQMRNNFNKKDITGINVSVYHGLICIISNDNNFYIWDYEYAKILLQVHFPNPNTEPIAIQFINSYSILLISTLNGMLYAFKLKRIQQLLLSCQLIYQHHFDDQITHIHNHISVKGMDNNISMQDAKVYLGNQNGKIFILNMNNFLKNYKKQPNIQSKLSYNPERQLKENFNTEIQKKKFTRYEVQSLQQNLQQIPIVELQGHRNSITNLFVLEMEEVFLVSGSTDKRIKVWKGVQQICDLNINLPLPYQWALTLTENHKVKQKIMVALKVIQSIFRKYGNDITIGQSKILRVKKLFETVLNQNEDITHLTEPDIPKEKIQQRQTKLFQNQFSIRDLHYNQIKQINFREIAGPTLRQIEMKRKIDNMQRQWQNNKICQQKQKEKLLNLIHIKAHKNEQKQQIMAFLQEKKIVDTQTKKLMNKYPEISKINQRLNNYIKTSILDSKQETSQTNINKTTKGKDKIPKVFTPSESHRKENKKQLSKAKSFEEYFQEKEINFKPFQISISSKLMSTSYKKFRKTNKDIAFRDILTEMNNKVRYSRQKKRWTTQQSRMNSTNTENHQQFYKRNIPLTSYSSMRVTHRNRGQL